MGIQSKKQFQGITLTDELRELVKQTIDKTSTGQDTANEEDADPIHRSCCTTKTNDKENDTKNPLTGLFDPMDKTESMEIIQSLDLTAEYISVPAIRALHSLLPSNNRDGSPHARLESALKSTKLCFSVPSSNKTSDRSEEEERQFQKRMDWLRCRQEESRYVKLTSNLGTVPMDDDVTTKSMMYAASVGLNMVVAPISFGVFMYFFGGSLLNFLFPLTSSNKNGSSSTDIRRVILGVVSGVAMLFIEMILFVIRTHELESAVRRKELQQRKKTGGFQPFGVYVKAPTVVVAVNAKVQRRSKHD